MKPSKRVRGLIAIAAATRVSTRNRPLPRNL
jgi:hypothetical protein